MATPKQPKEARKRPRTAARKPLLEKALNIQPVAAHSKPPVRVRRQMAPVQPVAPDPDSEEAIFGSEPPEPVYVQPQPPRLPGPMGEMQRPVPVDIGARARHVRSYSPKYTREFLYQTLRPLLLAGLTHDVLAQKFGCSTKTIGRWKAEIAEKLREECRNLAPEDAIGQATAHYDHLIAVANMTMSSAKNAAERLAAISQARAVQADKNRLFQIGGLFDRPVMGKGASQKDRSEQQADVLKEMSTEFLMTVREIRGQMGETVVGTIDGTMDDEPDGLFGDDDAVTIDVERSDAAQ